MVKRSPIGTMAIFGSMDLGDQRHVGEDVGVAEVIDGRLAGRRTLGFDDDAARIAEIDRHAVGACRRDEWSARTKVTVKPPRSVVPPVFIGLSFSNPFDMSHMTKVVVRGDCRAVGFGDIERIADVIAVAMREHDMRDPLDRGRLVGDEGGIAGEERIDQNRLASEIETKSGVAIPGDLHD